jgi:hypothetical protein
MPTYEIEAEDGTKYEVDAVNDAQAKRLEAYINERVKVGDHQLTGGTAPDRAVIDRRMAPARKAPESPESTLLGSTANALAGVGQGASALVDIPAQALGSIMGVAGDALGLPKWVTDAWRDPFTIGGAIDYVVPRPRTPDGQMVRAVAQGVGGAASGIGAGGMVARAASPVTKAVGKELAAQPVGQLGAGAVGAGVAEAARLGGAPVPVQLAAGIAAGGATPSSMRAVAGATEYAANRMVTSEGVRQAAAKMIEENASRTKQTIIDSAEVAPVMQRSGARPTLAEVTQDPGIAGLQRTLGNSSVTGGATIASRISENAIARGRATSSALGSGDPQALIIAAEARARTLERDAGFARAAVGPEIEPDVAGESLRDLVARRYQEAKGRTATAYDNPILEENPPVRLRPYELSDIADPPTRPVVGAAELADFQDTALKTAKGRLPNRPKTLTQWVRQQGGVVPSSMGADDLRASGFDARGDVGFINSRGRSLDELREGAVEQGYIPEDADLADFIEILRSEKLGAAPRFNDPDAARAYDEARQARDWWRQQFDEANLNPLNMSDDQWREFYKRLSEGAGDGPRTAEDLAFEGAAGKVMGPFQKTIMALRDRFFGERGQEAPAVARNFFNDVINADEVGLKTLEGWERQALDLASKAPDRTTAAMLQAMGRAIGAQAADASTPARREALATARGVRREQGEVFETGRVGRAMARGDYGRYQLGNSAVGATLVPKGPAGGEAVDQLRRAAGDAGAIQGVRAEIRRALDDAGTDPSAVARVARQYRPAINKLPEVAADLRRARAQAVLQRQFERSPLGRMVGAEGRDPNVTVARLLTADDAGQGLRQFSEQIGGNRMAIEGLRRSVAKWITDRSATVGIDANLQSVPSTAKLIASVETVLDRTRGSHVLERSQRALFNAVRRELRQDQFARSANRSTGSDTARNLDASLGMLRLATMIPGGDKARTALEVVMKVLGRADLLRDTLAEAMIDPKFAAQLLKEQHPSRMAAALRRIQTFNTGATTGTAASVD